MWLSKLLAHPCTRDMDIDSSATTVLRRQIILSKAFLKAIYDEWYTFVLQAIPTSSGRVVEIGSGGGFLRKRLAEALTTDVLPKTDVDLICRAESLPFADGSLRGIVMTNVFHHIPRPQDFLREASRCLRKDGVIAMVEPWGTSWSRFLYRWFHHEPFDDQAESWVFPAAGPLTQANVAMPWIIFRRDANLLRERLPEMDVEQIVPMMPLRYLLSGGVSMRALMPGLFHPLWRQVDRLLVALVPECAMFAGIVLRKRVDASATK